jgi:hypothetical protein
MYRDAAPNSPEVAATVPTASAKRVRIENT